MSNLITYKDCSIADTDKPFYRVEAMNIGNGCQTIGMTYGPINFFPLNFANAGNCIGLGMAVCNSYDDNTSNFVMRLEASLGPCDISKGSPCIITKTAHGLTQNASIAFSKTTASGAATIGTGLNDTSVFYVMNPSANTFAISAIKDGSLINTTTNSSAGPGLWNVLSSGSLGYTDIIPTIGTAGRGVGATKGIYAANINIPSTAVSASTNAYRFYAYTQPLGANRVYANYASSYPHTIAATDYWVWSDTSLNFTNGDTFIVKNYLTINSSLYTGYNTAVADYATNSRYAIYICSNINNLDASNNSYLRWENPPLASYTLKLCGDIVGFTYSGLTIGSSENRIPYSKQAIIDPSNWGFTYQYFGYSSNFYPFQSIQLYGEEPSIRIAYAAFNASSGQKIVKTDTSTGWLPGESLFYGPVDVTGVSYANNINTVGSVDGSTITMGTNLGITLLAGGSIINVERYGISIGNLLLASSIYVFPLHYVIKGTRFNNTITNSTGLVTYIPDPSYTTTPELNGNLHYRSSAAAYAVGGIQFQRSTLKGLNVLRNYGLGCPAIPILSTTYSSTFTSGAINIKDNINITSGSIWKVTTGLGTVRNLLFENNRFYNLPCTAYYQITCAGINNSYINNDWYGISLSSGSPVYIGGLSNSVFRNNTINRCTRGYHMGGSIINVKFFNERYGNLTANTTDFSITSGTYIDLTNNNSSTNINFSTTDYELTVPTSKFRVTSENGVLNADTVHMPFGRLKRTGYNLSDETVHTAGTDKYALRFEPTSTTDLLEWVQIVPTGNIQNLTMNISIWVKINSATYYTGFHQNPRITIEYDNGTSTYAEAIDTTDWQLLSCSFTPTTTFGQLLLSINGLTEATLTDAYFYIDDINVFYPPGVQLSLGNLNLWADALPVTPSIATNINAADVWNIQTSTLTNIGTIGKFTAGLDKTISNKIIPIIFAK